MTEIVFLSSLQGYQTSREKAIVERLKADRPGLAVRFLSPEESVPVLTKFKLKFGPAVVIDNRLEFIGVPRYRMLLERIEISKRRALAPPAPAAPAPATPAPAGAPPAKPAAPAPPATPAKAAGPGG